jgi:UDP-N-acetylmuramate--alanine ligase
MIAGKGDILYFLGIGGIGMSALARYFQSLGAQIHGYDKTPTWLTESLQAEGMTIHFDDRPDLIPDNTKLVIYTPAVPDTLHEFKALKGSGKLMMKRAEVLGAISRTLPTIAIAGTHGKTTVSSMIAHILQAAGISCTAFIGGISNNFGSNLVLHSNSQWLVVEADEYDRSFLQLSPQITVITSMDPDHLDIYGSREQMEHTYHSFAAGTPKHGRLIFKKELHLKANGIPTSTFSLSAEADLTAKNLHLADDKFFFDLKLNHGSYPTNIQVPGNHNVLNALAASAACIAAGIEPSVIAAVLPEYRGVKRRFDIIVKKPDFLYIDDYAHHPEELKAAIGTARALRPGKHLTGIFQPHLFSRTRDFMEGFAQSLSMLDELILLDIYPAREQPIKGISSEKLLEKVSLDKKILLSMEEAITYLQAHPTDVLMTLGAGDIDRMVEPIKTIFD